jgi:methylglyoxal synthase
VIECNVRASRSFPFVSKVTNHHFIQIATEVMLGKHRKIPYETLELDHVGVKTAQFSYQRLKGANPVAHVEMASTGEVACLGDHLQEAFFSSWMATEQCVEGKRILVSIGGDKKARLLPALHRLDSKGWEIFATENTHDFLCRQGVGSTFVYKASQEREPNVVSLIADKKVDLIINLPNLISSANHTTDGYKIRRLAIDNRVPLITNVHIALLFLQCLIELDPQEIPIKKWQEYHAQARCDRN